MTETISRIKDVYRKLPMPVRRRISSFRDECAPFLVEGKAGAIPIEACLLGGDQGVSATSFARISGDIRRASLPISEWPHVKLLRQYDAIGEQLWEPELFEQTDYYRNAALNIEACGRYFDAFAPGQIQWGARRFVHAYRGGSGNILHDVPAYDRKPNQHITVRPVKESACYEVMDGRHRLAIAYMNGVREVPVRIKSPAVLTPLQQLLLDVLWINGAKRELYQPIDSPEVAGWVLVRRCCDRLEKMERFLRTEGLLPPSSSSYLDVASYYGWFVAEMEKAGFEAEGVELDAIAISVGTAMYGLKPDQVHRGDVVAFLRSRQKRYDVTSCFSLMHHYVMSSLNISPEGLLGLLDAAT
jgi:hypothetical protein